MLCEPRTLGTVERDSLALCARARALLIVGYRAAAATVSTRARSRRRAQPGAPRTLGLIARCWNAASAKTSTDSGLTGGQTAKTVIWGATR
jgi:hypothetical protein